MAMCAAAAAPCVPGGVATPLIARFSPLSTRFPPSAARPLPPRTSTTHQHLCRAQGSRKGEGAGSGAASRQEPGEGHSRRGLLTSGLAAGLAAALAAGPTPHALAAGGTKVALFSGGSPIFLQPAFEELKYLGVKGTTCGSVDGVAAIRVEYDPAKVTYNKLAATYFKNVDPTNPKGQFKDNGAKFRTVIWAGDAEERATAELYLSKLQSSTMYGSTKQGPRLLVTEVVDVKDPAAAFEPGPEGEEMFYKENPKKYKALRAVSGRNGFFDDVWGPKTDLGGFVTFGCKNECLDLYAEYR